MRRRPRCRRAWVRFERVWGGVRGAERGRGGMAGGGGGGRHARGASERVCVCSWPWFVRVERSCAAGPRRGGAVAVLGPQAIPLLSDEDDLAPADDVVFHRVSSSVSQSSTASGPWSDPFLSASAWAAGRGRRRRRRAGVDGVGGVSGVWICVAGRVSGGANDSEVEAAGAMWTTYVSEGDLGVWAGGLAGIAGVFGVWRGGRERGLVRAVQRFFRVRVEQPGERVFVRASGVCGGHERERGRPGKRQRGCGLLWSGT